MIAEPTGTDGRPIIRKHTSVTGRLDHPVHLYNAQLFSCSTLAIGLHAPSRNTQTDTRQLQFCSSSASANSSSSNSSS